MTRAVQEARSEEEIQRLRAERDGRWRWIRAIHGRRPLLTAVVVLAAPAHAILTGSPVYDLLAPDGSWRFYLAWSLVVVGVVVRLWGSGNLRKNQEITQTGVYQIVRHPLYVGSLSFLLAFFLTATDPAVGLFFFAVLVAFVFYPTMLAEEEYLTLRFPGLADDYRPPPRLLPDPRRLPAALRTDRFNLRSAYRNLGFRGFWFVIALPLALRALRWIQVTLG